MKLSTPVAVKGPNVVANAFDPSTQEAEADLLSSRPTIAT